MDRYQYAPLFHLIFTAPVTVPFMSVVSGTKIDRAGAAIGADDYSRAFAMLRGKLIGNNGERYAIFVRDLKPSYAIVYRDIATGYVLLIGSFALTVIAPAWHEFQNLPRRSSGHA